MSMDSHVTFSSGKHQLTGLLRMPESSGPYPAVILLNGSEQESPIHSPFYIEIADALLEVGVACMIINKRGVGGSSGNWSRLTFQDRANDTLSAVQYLKNHPHIRPNQIGVYGHSQGGYICQLAASMSDEIAFIINSAGPGETVYKQILTDITNHSTHLPKYQRNFRIQLAQVFLSFIKWTSFIYRIHRLSYIIHYDPKPALQKIECPTLALFGKLDPLAPPDENIPIFEACFQQSGKTNATIITFPNADHSFRMNDRFIPQYSNTIVDWVKKYTEI